ncbi:patatin-like phospholipase family protein [Sphingomonas sp. J344]|uniref:patatin-like phospholipase family protein n=1 Tax=Sphingomonas sp. J344 TaxID=2898434 RepID=UPI00215190A0|nr:patatin-like phospholipase family protein [Sphingomonas sp. J344]
MPCCFLAVANGGSFGAGFLHELSIRPDARLPDFGIITGVSTGGLQSLFVALADVKVSSEQAKRFKAFLALPENAHIRRPVGDPTYIDLLQMNYSPLDEREIVSRNAKWQALYKGSFAGLKPLRARIERALCTDGDPAKGCPMIEHLATSGKLVLIGFIRVNDGRFVYADAVKLAKLVDDPALDPDRTKRLATIQQCLTGAALASAAMPVTFQQVQINTKTYLDGGVRRSVFDARVVDALERAAKSASAQIAAKPDPDTLTGLYVIRNGPTSLKALDPKEGSAESGKPRYKVDDVMIVTDVIERAQAIVVNELEVGSIAGLRLERPYADIWLATADGYDRAFPSPIGGAEEICRKEDPKAMFEPGFMRCLQRFGRYKGGRNFETDPNAPKNPWLKLSPIASPFKGTAGGTK